MKIRFTIIFIALCAVFISVNAQNDLKKDALPATNCRAIKDLINTDLFGAWVLELQSGTAAASTMRLAMERNPEFAESLAGNFQMGATRHEVFGDIEEGAFDLEESNNGKDIIALWKGRVQEGSCGQAITGTRRLVNTNIEQNFVLRRAGW